MRRAGLASGVLWVLLLPAPGAGAAAGTPDVDAVRLLEDRWLDALTHRDAAAVDAILAEAFVHTAWNGELLDKRATLARLREPERTHRTQQLTDVDVRLDRDTAVVTGINAVSGDGPTVRLRFTDVFVKRHGVWRAVSAQETMIAAP